MIPTLYNESETAFTSNGIGKLSEAISCTVTEERNGEYELEMEYPVSGKYYSEIKRSRIIYATPADGKTGQAFRQNLLIVLLPLMLSISHTSFL